MSTRQDVKRSVLSTPAPLVWAVVLASAAVLMLLFGHDVVFAPWAAFNTIWFTAMVVLDVLTLALLLAQYRSGASPRTLVLAWGYLVSAVLLVFSGLSVPHAFTVSGVWNGDLGISYWLWTVRHVAFPLVVGAALAPWPTRLSGYLSRPAGRDTRMVASSAVVVALVVATGALCTGDHSLPHIITITGPTGALRPIPEVILVVSLAAGLLAACCGLGQRGDDGIEGWAIVALVATTGDALIIIHGNVLDSLSFYGGRSLAVLATVVMLTFMLRQVGRAHRVTARDALRLEGDNSALLAAQQLRDHLSAMVSHDLRTPLAGLQGYLEILLDDEGLDPALVRRMHERSWVLTRRLTLLSEDLLAAATLENGDLAVTVETLDLEQQLRECALVFPDLDLRISCPVSLAVHADPLRLQQVLANLVRNAQLHGAEPVTITARVGEQGVVISVVDAGAGVPASFVPYLFDRYTQPAGTSGGSGLGLSVARDLVQAHGGSIRYDVDANGFVVTLPQLATPPARPPVDPAAGHFAHAAAGPFASRAVRRESHPGAHD